MKIQDLHTLKIRPDAIGFIDLREPAYQHAVTYVNFDDGCGDFATIEEALRTAALFRASHQMQEALRELIVEYEAAQDFKNCDHIPAIKQALAALTLSENTNETI